MISGRRPIRLNFFLPGAGYLSYTSIFQAVRALGIDFGGLLRAI